MASLHILWCVIILLSVLAYSYGSSHITQCTDSRITDQPRGRKVDCSNRGLTVLPVDLFDEDVYDLDLSLNTFKVKELYNS